MSKQHVITARVDEATLAGLNRLVEHHDRSRAWLVAKAVERYVKEETEFFAFVQEGEDSIDGGEFYTQEQMEEWLQGLKAADAA